jgi:hypothetical protein
MKKITFLLLAVALIWSACRKDKIDSIVTIQNPTPVEFVKTRIGGIVISDEGQPIRNAKVFIGNKTTETNVDGVFQIQDVTVNSRGAYIKVEHPNYFHGSKTINVSVGTRNKVKIRMMSNVATKIIDATTGGIADYQDYSVTLPANGIVNGDGSLFVGQVGVAAKWLNPSKVTFSELSPGRLMGVRTDGTLSGMVSMGMLAVELNDGLGNKLQIKKGQEAKIRLRVPSNVLSKAPETIPLWYFNEDIGIWVEEGEAKLINGFYEGAVGHFSFWNCDYPNPTVTVNFKVVDQFGNPIEGVHIAITITNGTYGGSGFTDNTGRVSGLIPKDENLTATLYAPLNNCLDDEVSLTQQIGPFSQDDMVTFTINLNPQLYNTVQGRLLDCNGNPIVNGYVKLNNFLSGDSIGNSNVVYTDSVGKFLFTVRTCSTFVTTKITGYDLVNFLASSPIDLNFVIGGVTDAGDIIVCGTAVQTYFTYTTAAGTYNSIEFSGSTRVDSMQTGLQTFITSYQNGGLYFSMTTSEVTGIGVYVVNEMYIEGAYINTNIYQYCPNSDCSGIFLTINEYNGAGGYVGGTYSGNLLDSATNSLILVSGSFRGILQ